MQRWRWPGNRPFDESIDHVAEQLRAAGYVEERTATASDRLTASAEFAAVTSHWQDDLLYIVDVDPQVGFDSPVSYYMKWNDGRLVEAQDALCKISGLTMDQLIEIAHGGER